MTEHTETETRAEASKSAVEPVVIAPLDKNYHRKNLERLLRDLNSYKPDEYARALLRLVCVADPLVMTEPEFTQQRLKAISDVVNGPAILPDTLAQ